MDWRQLRYFLAIAQEGSVAQASRRLHIAQPALSRHVRSLEEQFGVALFVRKARGVKLTDAGIELHSLAKDVLDAVAKLEQRMAGWKGDLVGELRVGVINNYGWLPIIRRILDELRVEFPGLRIHLQPKMSLEQIIDIRNSSLDVWILTWRSPADEDLDGFPIFSDRWAVGVPRSLAARYHKGAHKLADFANEPFLMFPKESAPPIFDTLMKLFRNAGVEPTVTYTASDISTLIGLVSSGVGSAIMPTSFRRHCSEDVAVFPLNDEFTEFNLEIVWRKGNQNVLLAPFLVAARKVARGTPGAPPILP